MVGHSLGDQAYLAGDSLIVRLYLRLLDPAGTTYTRLARLVDANGTEIWRDEGTVGSAFIDAAPNEIVYDHLEIQLPADATAGEARLTVDFYDASQAEPLPPEDAHLVTTIDVRDAVDVVFDADWGSSRSPNSVTSLSLSGERLSWPASTPTVWLTARSKHPCGWSTRPARPWPRPMCPSLPRRRSRWNCLKMPTPGAYTLAIVVYDAETLAPYPDQHGDFVTTLSTLTVR